MSEKSDLIRQNLLRVREQIAAAAKRAGRDQARVTVVGVTKTFPLDVVLAGYEAGLRHFGENRPEEGARKIPPANDAVSGPRPTWHMIGHIQSRKAKLAVAHFDLIHSIDSIKLARRLSRFAAQAGREMDVLLECNLSGETTKYGFPLHNWQDDGAQWRDFFAACAEIVALPGLHPVGLMTVAPIAADPEEVRPVFAALRRLRDELRMRFPVANWRELSMGMSDDFQVAVEEGATLVRIGRALFGPRPTR